MSAVNERTPRHASRGVSSDRVELNSLNHTVTGRPSTEIDDVVQAWITATLATAPTMSDATGQIIGAMLWQSGRAS